MTALALRSYQLDHHAFPQSLQQLTPIYLKSMPLDPFTAGKPLSYRKTGATNILYSLGPDMHDGGGKPITEAEGSPRPRYFIYPDSKGDIVAGINIR